MDETGKVLLPGAGAMQADGEAIGVGSIGAEAKASRAKFSEDVWAEAERDYFNGATAKEVSARYGMSKQTIYSRMGRRGKMQRRRDRKTDVAARPAGRVDAAVNTSILFAIAQAVNEFAERMMSAAAPPEGSVRVRQRRRADGTIETRLHFSEEIWEQARRDYERGSTAPRVAEWYGMTLHAVKRRARVEGWCKTVKEPKAPIHLPADPAQVEVGGDGKEISAWARTAFQPQLPPEGAWSTWLFQGGRGAGKTRAGAEWLAARAEASPHGLFALVGPTQHDVREVMIDGPSGLRNLPGRERPSYESSRRKLSWPSGAVAYAFSAEEPERLRGPQFEAAWVDEFCIWPQPETTLALLRMGMRLGNDPRLVVTTTPKPIAALRKLRAEVSCVTTQAPTKINAANLTPSFLDGLEALYGGTTFARQELEGELLDGDGALWTWEMIQDAMGERPDGFDRVVVAVDPPAGVDGSACGIVVAGRRGNRAYVLEDASVMGLTPLGWASRAVEAAQRHGARRIVAEANQGGEMVRTMLGQAGAKCPIELVYAREGKAARALPVSAFYQRKEVTHCGAFPKLEEELMSLGPAGSETKLDRADALVWALRALMLAPVRPKPRIGLL